jgi:hypothetical protein
MPYKKTRFNCCYYLSRGFDTTVLNGLPVTICYEVLKAEPDVGITSDYIEDMWILIKKERKNKGPRWEVARWIENRLTNKDWAVLEERAMEDHHGI